MDFRAKRRGDPFAFGLGKRDSDFSQNFKKIFFDFQ